MKCCVVAALTFVLCAISSAVSHQEAQAMPIQAATCQLVLVCIGTFHSTGYCNCKKCCGRWNRYKKTTGGIDVHQWKPVISVDPAVIRLGTNVYVERYGWRIASDTGGDIKGKRIEVFYPTHKKALHHGHGKGHDWVKVWVQKKVEVACRKQDGS